MLLVGRLDLIGMQEHLSPDCAGYCHLGGAGACTGCEVGLSAQWDLLLSCWSGSPEGLAQADSVSFKCVLSHFPAPGPLPKRREVLKQAGLIHVLSSCQPQTVLNCLQ